MAKYPVVVYGASGYTGMLTMDWLINQNIPFTCVARNAKRTQEVMAQRVMNLEAATYEIIEAEHNVESLVKAFKGAKVVCNTVGPFINFGLVGVEAAHRAAIQPQRARRQHQVSPLQAAVLQGGLFNQRVIADIPAAEWPFPTGKKP